MECHGMLWKVIWYTTLDFWGCTSLDMYTRQIKWGYILSSRGDTKMRVVPFESSNSLEYSDVCFTTLAYFYCALECTFARAAHFHQPIHCDAIHSRALQGHYKGHLWISRPRRQQRNTISDDTRPTSTEYKLFCVRFHSPYRNTDTYVLSHGILGRRYLCFCMGNGTGHRTACTPYL